VTDPSNGLSARAEVLGCAIDRVEMREAVDQCERYVRRGGFAQHMAINAAKLVAMRDDAELREIVGRCDLVTADGQAVVWASRLLGDALPERVAGIDLMESLLDRAEQRGFRVYFLGARAEVLTTAVERIRERHPALQVAGLRDGYFDADEEAAVADEIRAARADLLFVAMPSPAKEYFLGRRGAALGVPFVMGVGGSIDVMAGLTRRAPVLMQRTGLEWLFRLAQEPRRMFKRYLVTNVRFVAILGAAVLSRLRGRR
jgi:N-acetylglucosaminyldiphosphoundecaprenol N-acetyl-beta-D-mannosaminyltransferase